MRPDVDIDALMDRASSGDAEAFATVAQATQDELFRFCLAHGLGRADAAEAVQETLLRAYRGRRRWRRGGSAWAWLAGIAMNVAREARRKRRREVGSLDADVLAAAAAAPDATADRNEQRRDRLRRLAEAIEALGPRQREAVVCRYLLRMSVRQTAAAMGCATGTVKATVSAALAKLRRAFEPGDNE